MLTREPHSREPTKKPSAIWTCEHQQRQRMLLPWWLSLSLKRGKQIGAGSPRLMTWCPRWSSRPGVWVVPRSLGQLAVREVCRVDPGVGVQRLALGPCEVVGDAPPRQRRHDGKPHDEDAQVPGPHPRG